MQAEYDAKPWYGKAGQAADDIVRLIANGMTFGFADKLAGKMSGEGTEAERRRSEEAQMRAGSAGTVAKIGGAITPAVAAARAGLALPGIASGVTGVTGGLARTALGAVEGAGYGALDAKGNDRSISDGALLGAIFGGAGTGIGESLVGGASKIAGMFNSKPQIPTRESIETSARAAYDAADNSGVVFAPQAIDRLKNNAVSFLTNLGYDPALQPGAAVVLKRIEELLGNNVTFQGLDTLRKVIGNGFVAGNNSNNKAIAGLTGLVDDLVANPQAGEVLLGNAQNAGGLIQTARDLWSRLAKSNSVADAVQTARGNADAAHTGWNQENALRQAMNSLQKDASATRGFTPDEMAALSRTVAGSPDQNALRHLGRLAPTGTLSMGLGGGIGAGSLLGTMLGGPYAPVIGALAAPAIGFGARIAATNMEMGAINRLGDIILSGGSAARALPQPNAVQQGIDTIGPDIVRAIFGGAQQTAGAANERMRSPARRWQ